MDVRGLVQVIKIFLIVMACAKPDFTLCEQIMAMKVTGPDPMYWCLLNRPRAAVMWQTRLNDGWLTFTRCQNVNPTKDGRLG